MAFGHVTEVPKKSTWKQHVFFQHQSYIGKKTWKQHANHVEITWIFDHRNSVGNSTRKRRGFFDQRNYIKKVRGNDVEICHNFVFDVSM